MGRIPSEFRRAEGRMARPTALQVSVSILLVLAAVVGCVLAAGDSDLVQSLVYNPQYSAHKVNADHCSIMSLGCVDHKKDVEDIFDAAIKQHYETWKLFPKQVTPSQHASLSGSGSSSNSTSTSVQMWGLECPDGADPTMVQVVGKTGGRMMAIKKTPATSKCKLVLSGK